MPAIELEGVSKRYRLGTGTGYLIRELPALWNRFTTIVRRDAADRDLLWAVSDLSFQVEHGQAVGIIGANGAGKSTTLSLLAGITFPTQGTVRTEGRIAAMIQLGAGFSKELSGRDNIYLNGMILGMKKKEIEDKFDSIVEFAGLERFIDTPVKRYSTGMYVRLGFAVAAHVDPDILLIDEVLSVGDAAFQSRCLERMNEFVRQAKTIVFVSHNLPAVQRLCSRVIWLDAGIIRADGEPDRVIAAYSDEMQHRSGRLEGAHHCGPKVRRGGSGEIRFTEIQTVNRSGQPVDSFPTGGFLGIRASYAATERIYNPLFRFCIRDVETGVVVVYADSYGQLGSDYVEDEGVLECAFESLSLRPRRYSLYLLIQNSLEQGASYDVWDDIDSRFVASTEGVGSYGHVVDPRADGLVSVPFRVREVREGAPQRAMPAGGNGTR